MKRLVVCTLTCLLIFAQFSQAQIGVFTKIIADSVQSKDFRFRTLPSYSLYNGLTNIISPTTGTYDLTTPAGTTIQRPTVPAGKYILRFNTDSLALEIGNPSQVWKTLSMSSVQTFDTSSIPNFSVKVRSLFTATSPLQYNSVTGNLTLPQATSSQAGYLASADWVIFNAKLPDPGSNGLVARTALGTTASRQLIAASANVSIVNANGVSGNPSLDLNDTLILDQIQLNKVPVAAGYTDSALTINRITNRPEMHPILTGGGGSGTFNKAGGGISSTGDSLYLTNLTANRALITSSTGIPQTSSVTSTEVGYLSGVTSAIQTQLNTKLSNITGLITAGTSIGLTGSGTSGSPYNISSLIGGTNGLTKTGDNLLLGGTLSQTTTIANATFDFTISGTGTNLLRTNNGTFQSNVITGPASATINANNSSSNLFSEVNAIAGSANLVGGNSTTYYNTVEANTTDVRLITRFNTSPKRLIFDNSGYVTLDAYPSMVHEIDTTTNKAIGYNTTTGKIVPMNYWPGSGGGTSGITQLTGDGTAGPGSGSQALTITANTITNAKSAQMAAHTFKGNNTGSTSNASDLTATQLTAELNIFGASLKGLVPAAAASPSSTKYLSEDGTFSTPAGGGSISGLTIGRVVIPTSGTTVGDDAGLLYNSISNTITTDSLRILNARINEDPYNADSIRFHGTSISVGVGQSAASKYTTLVSARLNAKESNFGISGATLVTQGVANIWKLPVWDRSKYRWIVLEWGVNDNQLGVNLATFCSEYRKYIDTLTIARGWPSSRIIILSPSYVDPVLFATATLVRQLLFRDSTQAIATDKGCKWVDIHSLEAYRNPTINLLVDGIHPNDYGAAVYAQGIAKVIGDSVMTTNQNVSVNGYTELQRLKLRTVDTADYNSMVAGYDGYGNFVRFTKDQVIQNSETLLSSQGASINLTGRGYFGNVSTPTAAEIIQVNGMVKGNSLRAVGSAPSGLTGSGVEISLVGSRGLLTAIDRDGFTQLPLVLNSYGDPASSYIAMMTSSAPTGSEKIYAPVAAKFNVGQFAGTLPGGLVDPAVEIGLISSSIGYVGAYNRTTAAPMILSLNGLGGNVIAGGYIDDGIGALQDKGKLTITIIDSVTTPLNMLYADPTTGEVKKAAIPGGGTTIYSGNGTLAGNRTVTGGNNSLTFNGIFNFRINANSFLLGESSPDAVYSTTISGVNNQYLIGYTPVPTVYSKGYGIYIDTNNNAGLATAVPTTVPLYSTGSSAYVSGIQSGGGNFYRINAITGNTTATLAQYWFDIDATSGNITVTLPAASTAFGGSVGIQYVFRRTDNTGNTVTISRAGSDTINGTTSTTLSTQYETKEIQCTSTTTWGIK